MAEVYRRKLALDKYTPTLTAVTYIHYISRIILKKLTTENKSTFRKLEKSVKFSLKCDADIKLINFYINNYITPKIHRKIKMLFKPFKRHTYNFIPANNSINTINLE